MFAAVPAGARPLTAPAHAAGRAADFRDFGVQNSEAGLEPCRRMLFPFESYELQSLDSLVQIDMWKTLSIHFTGILLVSVIVELLLVVLYLICRCC